MPLIKQFVNEINTNPQFIGDILEFGTGSGSSTAKIASAFNRGKIFTYDGFVGLPKTNKVIPAGTNWGEGNYNFSEESTRNTLRNFQNITVEKCMMDNLKTPKEYGITKISGVNIDLDLYEGTLDALYFMDKCEWSNVLIRFDDWGHSKDYVKAMHMILNNDEAEDFVVSTMQTHSVRELVEYVFNKLDLDYTKYVTQNPKFIRPEELKYLKGDSTKIRTKFGWKPKYTFETLLDDMINHWDEQIRIKKMILEGNY